MKGLIKVHEHCEKEKGGNVRVCAGCKNVECPLIFNFAAEIWLRRERKPFFSFKIFCKHFINLPADALVYFAQHFCN